MTDWNPDFIKGYLNDQFVEDALKCGSPLADYLEERGGRVAWLNEIFGQAYAPCLKNDDNILEIGTGAGHIAERCFRAFKNIVYYSYEPDSKLSDYLSKRFENRAFFSINGSGADLAEIPDQCIDVVLSYNVLTYLRVSVVFSYLKETARVLKPGGKTIVHVFECDKIAGDWMLNYDKHLAKFDDRVPYSATFLKKCLSGYGLEFVREYSYEASDPASYLVFQKLPIAEAKYA